MMPGGVCAAPPIMSVWVNLIGKGYAAPRTKFRWCTDRLKIRPSNRFIIETTAEQGRSVLVLGTRSAESAARAARMRRAREGALTDTLVPNENLPGSLVYTPIAEWSNDEVWQLLMDFDNPWGTDNHELFAMYRGATADNECPLVVDTGTPSCGDSRFGCWVCTLVEKDRSIPFGAPEMALLLEACEHDTLHFELVRELLDIEARHATLLRRAGLFDKIQAAFAKHGFANPEEAIERAKRKRNALAAARGRDLAGARHALATLRTNRTEHDAGTTPEPNK